MGFSEVFPIEGMIGRVQYNTDLTCRGSSAGRGPPGFGDCRSYLLQRLTCNYSPGLRNINHQQIGKASKAFFHLPLLRADIPEEKSSKLMGRADHVLNEVATNHSDWSLEDTFAPPRWYFDQCLFVQDMLEPGNTALNYALPMHIRGPLDQEALERSFQEVMRRHNVLRSIFRMVDGKLAQVIVPLQPLAMPVLDLSGLPESDRQAKARQLVQEDVTRPFALGRDQMLRTRLLRLGTENHILQLTTHHLVCDDWSTGILFREIFAIYAAFNSGKPSPFPEMSYQYGDFARWLDRRLQGKNLESRFRFWRERLAGGNDFHHVSTDHLRPTRRTYGGRHERAIFPEELGNSVKLLSLRERVSPFMTMLAGFQCLLHRYSGHEVIGVGSCVANRALVDFEGLIGPFANVLVLRTDLSGNPSFREVLLRAREVMLAAYSFQDLPFGSLVQTFQPVPDPSRHPLFQTLFVLHDAPKEMSLPCGLTVDPFPLETEPTRYELNFGVRMQGGLRLDVQYNSDLFEEATIKHIVESYRTILEAIVNNPEERIGDLQIPTVRETNVHIQPPRATTRDKVEAKLVEMWQSMLGQQAIRATDDYFQLGGTSLQAVRLFAQIEEAFGVKLPLSTLAWASTVKELAEAVRKDNSAASCSCLVEIQPGDSRPPFFCIHGAGGNVLRYRDLVRYLGPDQPVYGVQPTRQGGKRPLLTRIEDMAALYVEEIQALQPQGPYYLGGYCMAGTIALEMAQQLHSRGQKVALLALFDCYNWAKLEPDSVLKDIYFYSQWARFRCGNFFLLNSKDKLRALQRKLKGFRGRRAPWRSISIEEVLILSQMGALLSLVDKVARNHRNGNRELSTATQLFDVNVRAALKYVPKVYPGRIFHFCSMKRFARYNRPGMDWDGLAADGVENVILPVYPGGMLGEPFVRDLAAKLRRCIEELTAHQKFAAHRL
jgi:acyl carrier protein